MKVLELSLTVQLSEASTKLWNAFINPAALVEAIIRAERAFKVEHEKKRRKVAAEIGTACGAALLMLAAISIPL